MSNPTELAVPITTSPIAALLAATGVAGWLADTGKDLAGDPIDVQIANAGHSIVVSTASVVQPDQITSRHYQPPQPRWILTAKNGPAPTIVNVLDYEAERQHNSDYYDRLKAYRKAGMNVRKLPEDQRRELEEMAPHDYWPVAALINQMGALNAYNKAIERWAACRDIYPDLVAIIWTMCSGQPAAIESAMQQWEDLAKRQGLEKSPLLSATQAVNPEQGKGANRAKADKLDIGGQESFWLLEYFKFAGLYRAALPRVIQGKKDRKTYIVMPSREGISLRWYQQVFDTFRKEFWAGSAIQMDIQAALRYTAAMLEQWEAARQSSGRRRRVSDFIDGFAVASFKDLGSAVAMMNVATIRLPDWVEWPADLAHAQQLKLVVAEHQKLIAALDEKHGEEEQLLRDYRDFLSSRDPALDAFFAFTTGYAGHTIRKMSKRQPVRRFSIEHMEVIIMANEERRKNADLRPLSRIIENTGFRNIATAIRRSTVIPQRQKVDGNTPYEFRYGLADDLRRKARNRNEFISALSEFMQQYVQENKRVFAREKRAVRADITTKDIAELVQLIDEYDTLTVANLLIAFGYARDPKAPEAPIGSATETTPETDDPTALETEDDSEQPF
jgi:hypothetical protein